MKIRIRLLVQVTQRLVGYSLSHKASHILFILLNCISFIHLLSFEESELNLTLKKWENENNNEAIVLITSPSSGKIEYAYTKQNAFTKKIPAGSILKTLSTFVFLANPEKFNTFWDKKFICNGKFEEPYSGFFTVEDRAKFNLIKDEESGKYFFQCSIARGHGEISMAKALALSCNAYYLHFASKNSEFFADSLIKSWKLNQETDADFDRHTSTYKNSKTKNRSVFASTLMSIGDEGEIKLTAIKIAQLFGAIFSNTEILKPIRKGDIPGTINHFPYPDIMREKVQEALRLTITDGTLKTIQLQNSSIQILGGKTGTPTQEGKKFHTHGWNILYFKKADTPFLLVVFTKNGSGKKEAIALSTIILNLI